MELISRRRFGNYLAAGVLVSLVGCAGSATSESTGEYVDDSAITTKVKSKLLKEKGLESLKVSVETYKGVVQLSGFVDTESHRAQAESVARSVDGVVDVKNDLVVK